MLNLCHHSQLYDALGIKHTALCTPGKTSTNHAPPQLPSLALKTESHSVAQAILEQLRSPGFLELETIAPPLPPKGWEDRCEPPHPSHYYDQASFLADEEMKRLNY